MKLAWVFGVVSAVILHVLVLLFGGLVFPKAAQGRGSITEVELLEDPADAPEAKPEPEEPEPPKDDLETSTEEPPDAAEIVRSLEQPSANDAPELEAMSLSAIEAALSGQAAGSGDFAQGFDLVSGGRIGGTGKAGALEELVEKSFSMAEIDQKPRALFQREPVFPPEMRGKKIEGVVTVTFVVDASGKVADPRVEKSSHPAFDKPALDAVRQWKFEPAVKGGQRVGCKMRVPIRFQPR